MKKIISLIIILLVCSNFLSADQGRAGAQFLKIFPGVYGPSMAGTGSTLNPSPEVVFWNPAGLNDIKKMSLAVSSADYFADIKYGNIAFAMPMSFGVLSFHTTGLFSGDIRETTTKKPDGTGDFYSKNDLAFGMGFGKQMTNKFTMGVSGKFLSLSIDDLNAYGFSLDAGAKYVSGLPGNLIFAFTIKNFGPNH